MKRRSNWQSMCLCRESQDRLSLFVLTTQDGEEESNWAELILRESLESVLIVIVSNLSFIIIDWTHVQEGRAKDWDEQHFPLSTHCPFS